jgi:hypothetical protein
MLTAAASVFFPNAHGALFATAFMSTLAAAVSVLRR